ncbi:flagellar basal body L-ring protein FlgH [Pontivivens insulae]|uniref:Flagellar L-ring protein n=1 Tax=Pontivivens insulae TaxID=1639689 RepID=A0A2R8A9H7_9RHOB|nr:flagellar basal body L-ring protein FlgH [Pontivivens insulae]RED12772.1 flagellar L-ring protein precursor FlgH [Pontivivens insulae]SPF28863.1 Flagellar L-ring protein [Pontivivens insulae]
MRALCLLPMIAAGCASSPIGQPPPVTPVDAPVLEVVTDISPERLAIAEAETRPDPVALLREPSLWRSGPDSLFGDRRAQALGDILTVVIEIDEEAEIRNATDRSRTGDQGVSLPSLFGFERDLEDGNIPTAPLLSTSSNSGSAGSGTTRRNERITLRIAATIVDVLPNGHLVVMGSQEVRVNFELRDLQVAGIVRPEDISRRNEITYDKIAGARIVYGGRGQITDLQQPRYGQQILDQILPF